YYLDGVPVIARATGGIVQQVIPWCAGASYSDAVRTRTSPGTPTGILYREPDAIGGSADPWRPLNNATNDYGAWHSSALYAAMTEELTLALADAEQVTTMPHVYAGMAIAGALHIQHTFSWHKNRGAYQRQLLLDLQAA